jgi:hypothetical protein
MSERVRDILQKAGVESAVRQPLPQGVIEHPLRSKFLDRTANAVEALSAPAQPEKLPGREVPAMVAHALTFGPYVSVAFLTLTVFILAGMISGYFTRQAILADIGETTCSAEMSLMWIEEDPDSNVPRLKDEVLTRCAKAQKLS